MYINIKTHFYKKGFAISLVLKVKILELGKGQFIVKPELTPHPDRLRFHCSFLSAENALKPLHKE